MLSTMHTQPKIESISDHKSSIILFYNKIKDGVDTLRQNGKIKLHQMHDSKKAISLIQQYD